MQKALSSVGVIKSLNCGCKEWLVFSFTQFAANAEQLEEVEICLDRPFYYILCKDEIPFLIGIINQTHQKTDQTAGLPAFFLRLPLNQFCLILCKDEIPFLIGIINNPAE